MPFLVEHGMSMFIANAGQSITTIPSARIAVGGGSLATTRLFWPGRFLLATSRRPGESCTGGDILRAVA